MSVQLANATISDEALVSIVRGAVGRVEGLRLDQPGRVSRVLPGRRGAVSWELDARGVAFALQHEHHIREFFGAV